ncbi:MAG: GSCFA domain-containing protein [Flavobacteriales bacterium]
MDFNRLFTSIEPLNWPKNIAYNHKLLSVGSCFSTEIGNILLKHKFNIKINPFGTIFNPISMFHLLEQCISLEQSQEHLFIHHHDLWYHYNWHSSIHAPSKDELIEKIEAIKINIHKWLKTTDYLILTFGTSIVRCLDHQVVNNCHKQPSKQFTKRFLEYDELKTAFDNFYKKLLKFNPNTNLILTTSPVRHTKEGLIENSRSKALLQVFNQYVTSKNYNCLYFPSYEIMNDVLRDYRYYKPDLIHPSEEAVNVIWNFFVEGVLDEGSKHYLILMKKYLQMNNHVLLQPKSSSAKQFLLKKEKLKLKLEQEYWKNTFKN